MVKYRAHPSATAIKENYISKSNFNFSFVEKVDILKKNKMLQLNKATHNTDIPTKLIKDNADIFADFSSFFFLSGFSFMDTDDS